jgi:hypothetical protein
MSPLPALASNLSAPPLRVVQGVRGAGKANTSRTLDGECAGDDGETAFARPSPRVMKTSHSGTTECAPLWNGPALCPTFVAQVLGQVMMEPQEDALRLRAAAYGKREAAPRGLVFRREV